MYRYTLDASKDIHLEDLRIALFSYICAKQNNDRFIARIANNKKKEGGKYKNPLAILDTFNIKYDEVYHQSNNFKYHLQFASTFLDEKKAFICFCTENEINNKKKIAKKSKKTYIYDGACENLSQDHILNTQKPFVIRMKKPMQSISFTDTTRGDLTFKNDDIDSFVIMSADKYPTYNFASAIDDMLQGITHIVEKDQNILNAPKQEHIRRSIGYNEKIIYTHLPEIQIKLKDKTNKIQYLLDLGYIPEAIINYLISLGNKPPKKIFTLNEALKWFNINSIEKSEFDIDKLRFINKEHIKLLDDSELAKRIGYSGKNIGKLARLYAKEKGTTFEIKQMIDAIFSPKKLDGKFSKNLEILKDIVKNAPEFEKFDDFTKYLINKTGFEEKSLLEPLKILLTNKQNGPELADMYPLIKNYIKEVVK